MRIASISLAVVLIASIAQIAFAQYGPGGGYGGGGYSPPTPPTPAPPSPYRQPNYQPPSPYGNNPSPHRGNPYSPPQTNHYRGQPTVPAVPQVDYEYQTVYELYCESCNKKVPSGSKAGDRCPHCGVYWTHDDEGNSAPGGGFGFGGFIGLAVAAVVIAIRFIVRMAR